MSKPIKPLKTTAFPLPKKTSTKIKEEINAVAADVKELLAELEQEKLDDETIDMLTKFLKTKKKRLMLDKDLVNHIKSMFKEGCVKDNKQKHYQALLKDLQDEDIIIYFKDADKLVLYETTQIMDFIIRFDASDNIYEVVNNDKPQKIIIVGDSSINSDIKKVKRIIIDFMKKKNLEVCSDDIFVFDNTVENKTEFLITSVCVNDEKEKREFINDLIKYINKNVKDGDKIVKKLKKKMLIPDINTEIEDASSCHISFSSNGKKLLGYEDEYIPKRLLRNADMFKKFLVSNVKNCNNLNPSVVNVNIVQNIVHNDGGNVNIGNDNVITINNSKYKSIVSELKKKKPSWYRPGVSLKKTEIYEHFLNDFKKHDLSERQFWKEMKNYIVSSEERVQIDGKRYRCVTLKKIW